MTHPIPAAACEGADVDPATLDALLGRVADYFRGKERALERRYECAITATDGIVLFADTAFWERTGEALGFSDVEVTAVERAHEATLLLAGDRADRLAEFETALDVRTAVVLGR